MTTTRREWLWRRSLWLLAGYGVPGFVASGTCLLASHAARAWEMTAAMAVIYACCLVCWHMGEWYGRREHARRFTGFDSVSEARTQHSEGGDASNVSE